MFTPDAYKHSTEKVNGSELDEFVKESLQATSQSIISGMDKSKDLIKQFNEAKMTEYEKDWEWRRRQEELLAQVVDEQKKLADGSEKSYKAALSAAIIAGIGIVASVVIAVLSKIL